MTDQTLPSQPISRLRTELAETLRSVRETPILLTYQGEPAGVLVHPQMWLTLLERLEDYEDASLAEERAAYTTLLASLARADIAASSPPG